MLANCHHPLLFYFLASTEGEHHRGSINQEIVKDFMPFLTIVSLNNPEASVMWEPRPLERAGTDFGNSLIERPRKFADVSQFI